MTTEAIALLSGLLTLLAALSTALYAGFSRVRRDYVHRDEYDRVKAERDEALDRLFDTLGVVEEASETQRRLVRVARRPARKGGGEK